MKRILTALAVLLCLSVCVPAVQAAPAAAAKTPVFSSAVLDWSVDENGRSTVKETYRLTLTEPAETLSFSLPENASHIDVAEHSFKTKSADGTETVILRSKEPFSGDLTVRISYRMKPVVSAEDGKQSIVFPLLRALPYPVEQMELTVTMPEDGSLKPVFSSTHAQEFADDYLEISRSGQTITASLLSPLKEQDSLTLSVVVPKGYFPGRLFRRSLLPVLTVLSVLSALGALLYWWRLLKNPALRVQARPLPPDGVNPGDLPHLLSGGRPDFSLLVCHWAALGYLSIFVNQSGHVILRRKMSMGNERRVFERKLFDYLFSREDYCDGASLHYRHAAEKAMAVIPRYWNKKLFSQESGSPFLARILCCLSCGFATMVAMDSVAPDALHGLLLVLALVAGFALSWMLQSAPGSYYLSQWPFAAAGMAAGLLLLILGLLGSSFLLMAPAAAVSFFLGWQTCHGGKRVSYGDEVIAQAMGFRRFLLHVSDRHLSQNLYRDPQYFYKMLPYAQAMGLGRRLTALLMDRELEPCQWYETAGKPPLTAGSFYLHFCETLAMLRTSIRER